MINEPQPTSPEFYQRVRELFGLALGRPDTERVAFVRSLCAAEPNILQAVIQLLEAHTSAGAFLESSPPRTLRVGRYWLVGELGRGSMGTVYDALDPEIGRRVALKVIRPDALKDSEGGISSREWLFREVRAAGSLIHPGIVIVFDVGQDGETAFFAMEKVEGPSLGQLLASGRKIAPNEATDILRQTAAALDYAHQHGIVHRDIKPANIMLANGTTVKVADFSIAKMASAQTMTATGMVWGTPSYMSPEQVQGRPVDGRSDQFSLAVVAYELLTGCKPFRGDSLASLAAAIAFGPRPSALSINPDFPQTVDDVLRRGMASSREERYASCTDFAANLTMAFDSVLKVGDSRPVSGPQKMHKPTPIRRFWVTVSVGALVAALLVLAVRLQWFSFEGKKPSRSTAAPTVTQPSGRLVATENKPAPSDSSKAASTGPESNSPQSRQAVNRPGEPRKIYEDAVARHDDDLLQRAAGMGYAPAMVRMGELCLDKHREQEASKWFQKAADAGDASGMVHIGGMYQLGMGVVQNAQTAVEWYRRAADAGNASGMFDLGAMYENGLGVPVDLGAARSLYEKAARLGNAEAESELTHMKNH
jgi:serine/threonine protein kinase